MALVTRELYRTPRKEATSLVLHQNRFSHGTPRVIQPPSPVRTSFRDQSDKRLRLGGSRLHILGAISFGRLHQLICDQLSLFEGLIPVSLNGAIVHKDVRPILWHDEAKSLSVVKPLNLACCHMTSDARIFNLRHDPDPDGLVGYWPIASNDKTIAQRMTNVKY